MLVAIWRIEIILLAITAIGMVSGLITSVKQYSEGRITGFTVCFFTIGLIATALAIMIMML